jgi:heavy metal efflux system protein
MVALCIRGRVKEGDKILIRWAKRAYEPVLTLALRLRYAVVLLAVAAFGGALLLFGRLGQEFIPTLDEQDLAVQAFRIPSAQPQHLLCNRSE